MSLLTEAMPADGITPDTVSYNAAITAHANAQPARPDGALSLLRAMEGEEGSPPDNFSYNGVISALGRAGRWEEAVALLRQLAAGEVAHGGEVLSPDQVSYTAAISACAEAGRAAEAAALLEELRSSGLPLSILPFSKAIAAAAKAGEWRTACATLRQASSLQLRHNALTTNLARGLIPIDCPSP
mmetsp:Transcript_39085/g.123133  ORF Transcript_39085/g.123133 Transcript_39085/m.123133 type:complete len:185 (+) Transcript_39085:173-727(+)